MALALPDAHRCSSGARRAGGGDRGPGGRGRLDRRAAGAHPPAHRPAGRLAGTIAIALHIPEGYTQGLAQRLDDRSQISIKEASEGMELRPGLAILAPGGRHLRFERTELGLVARLARDREGAIHVPSVDVLFESAALEAKSRVLAVVLTGMGSDGLAGARRLAAVGARIVTEAESSCVVYGMPNRSHEAGLSNEEATLEEMAAALVRCVTG